MTDQATQDAPTDASHRPAVAGQVERSVMRPVECRTVAALYVEPKGCYVGVPGVDPWDEARDARKYAGPHPVVAHPPCQRWGRFWHGSTRKPHQYKLGDDGGCFAAALAALKRWGGVLEHPAHSRAWEVFGIRKPLPGAGWWWCPDHGVWVCHVEQGHYGHDSRKPTWLIAAHVHRNDLPELNWTKGEQRLPAWMVERYGYEKARRIGVVAMVGGKNKTAIRNATPPAFRDLLLSIARQAHNANCAIKEGLVAKGRDDITNHLAYRITQEGRRWVNDLDAPLVIPPTEPEPVVAAPEAETAPEPSEPEPLGDTIEAQLTSESACYAILHPRRGLIVVGEIRDDAIRLATELAETNGQDVALFRLMYCGEAVLKAQFKEAA